MTTEVIPSPRLDVASFWADPQGVSLLAWLEICGVLSKQNVIWVKFWWKVGIQTFSIRHTQMKSRAVTLAIKNHSHFLQEKVDLQGVGSLLIVNTDIGGVCGIFFPVSSPRSTNVCLSSCGGKIRSARFLVEMGRANDTLSNY